MTRTLDVLLVEDNAMNRRLAGDLLRYRGHEVRAATNVEQARALFDQPPPDVALLDIQLPDGNGRDLLAEIRDHPAWSNVPVLAVTALAMRGDSEQLLADGFDGYISKPIDVDEFTDYVESFAV